jgi:hypothetical protein
MMRIMSEKVRIKNGLMHKVEVYEEGVHIGTGYFIHYADDTMSEADLISHAGERLPEGWYQLMMTDEVHYVVVPTRNQ